MRYARLRIGTCPYSFSVKVPRLRAAHDDALRFQGSEKFRKVQKGSERFRKVQKGSERFRKVQKGSERFRSDFQSSDGGYKFMFTSKEAAGLCSTSLAKETQAAAFRGVRFILFGESCSAFARIVRPVRRSGGCNRSFRGPAWSGSGARFRRPAQGGLRASGQEQQRAA